MPDLARGNSGWLPRMARVAGCSGPDTRSRMGSPSRIPRVRNPVGEAVAVGQGGRVLGAQHPLLDGQRRRELVAGPGCVPGMPGETGQVGAGDQGFPDARSPVPARGWAAARRAGRGRRPHPPPCRCRGQGWRGRSGWPGARSRAPAPGWAAARRTGGRRNKLVRLLIMRSKNVNPLMMRRVSVCKPEGQS
jgi:hypothetical protein